MTIISLRERKKKYIMAWLGTYHTSNNKQFEMSPPSPEQILHRGHRPQQVSSSRIRPCYRDRQASISSQPGVFRAPASTTTRNSVAQNRHTPLPYTPRRATSTPTAIPRPATSTRATNTIGRSDIRVLTDQFKSVSANQPSPSLSIVEICGRSLPLTKQNLGLFLNNHRFRGAHVEEVEDIVMVEVPGKDKLRMRVVSWQEGVRLASRKSGLEFGT